MSALRIGSEEHKEVLCRLFIDTHDPYRPEEFKWPELAEEARTRLAGLPIWNEAVRFEAEAAVLVPALAEQEKDPLLKEAIALMGFEEGRHAELLRLLTKSYGIPIPSFPIPVPPDCVWSFMRFGYAECFDSFFAFGLFAMARASGFFPPDLVDIFEPVMQEEARHILFNVNWMAYHQARLGFARRPTFVFRRGLALWLHSIDRIKLALHIRGGPEDRAQEGFTFEAHQSFSDVTPRGFIDVCLRENERRLKPYDPRLLRPTFVPTAARVVRAALGRQSAAQAIGMESGVRP